MGTLNNAHNFSSHFAVFMFKRLVLEAFVASLICRSPLVRRHIKNVSIVPNASSPFSARALAPSTLSRIQAIFEALK